ncbi:MAG: DciA family protein [Pseudomonadota bacterium]
MSSPTSRRHHAVPLHEAVQGSPTFARLMELARESAERLLAIESLIPPALRTAVRPGPIEGTSWCLLVDSSAAAAKLRQSLPAFQAKLSSRGWEVTSIRLRVGSGQKSYR